MKAPTAQRLPDIVTVAQMQQIIAATKVLSYRVFFYTRYSLGLRLGEGLRLQVGDIDAGRGIPGGAPGKWIVNCKNVGAGDKALVYLGRYLYRGVIQEKDILTCKNKMVRFSLSQR